MATESFNNSYSLGGESSIVRQVRTRRDYVVFQREEQETGEEEEEGCQDGGGGSAFTILNFILSSISLAANAVSDTNSNSNNNNNNNNDNNNNDNNVNVANNNNLAGNVNQVMFLPAVGRRRKRSPPPDPEYSRLAIAAIRTFVELEGCGSLSCRASLLCGGGQSKAGKIDAVVAEHLLEGSRRYFNLTSVQC